MGEKRPEFTGAALGPLFSADATARLRARLARKAVGALGLARGGRFGFRHYSYHDPRNVITYPWNRP